MQSKPEPRAAVWLLLLAASVWTASAGSLSDSAVDRYNVRVGTQTFSGLYHFTTNTLLVETAQAIQDMGSDTLKLILASSFPGKYGITLPPNITNLVTLVRDEPSCRRVFDMPFQHYIAWTYAFSTATPDWNNGYVSPTDQANDYREFYDLTRYLLTNYNNSGKTFYLGHWEGDGYLCPNSSWTTDPTPTMVQGFINYLDQRQKAIDNAKLATAFTNVNVFGYAEANRVIDARNLGHLRMINSVIPYVTNLDYVSYSSYDLQRLSSADMTATLDYVEAHLPANKASVIPGERVWIGEYGFANAGDTPAQQEPESRAYIQRLLNYGRQGLPFILFWEIYDNETNTDGSYKYFYLIDPANAKSPCYYLHQRFINTARLSVAQFKERNGRLPTDSEFVALVSPLLDTPLSAPVNLAVANLSPALVSPTAVQVSGSLAQGVYGDDAATVWVFYGRQDGGAIRSAWEQRLRLGINTNFNPTTFIGALTNLAANTNYFFRFYSTNATGEAWAPASARFTTLTLNPADFACRLKVTFTGYNRSEALDSFPVLVSLRTNLPGFAYQQFASPTGGNLRFTDARGVWLLPHEIDEWNSNGTSSVWVRVPRLAATNDCLWAYWGNPAATTPPTWATDGSVWSADHYLVWHLKESTFPYADSAQQHPALSGTAPATAAGLVGRACAFNGASQFLNAGAISLGAGFTLSAWVKLDLAATNIQTVWANKTGGWNANGFALFVNSYNTSDQSLALETGDGINGKTAASTAGAVSPGQWHRLTAVVDQTAGTARLYVDGADRTQAAAIQGDFANQSVVNLGRFTNSSFYLKGTLDEVRIASTARSSNWVWASWMTVAANTALATYSAVNPRPRLSLAPAAEGVELAWPASSGVFMLYSTTSLSPAAAWTPVTNPPPLLAAGLWALALQPSSDPARFFRLQAK